MAEYQCHVCGKWWPSLEAATEKPCHPFVWQLPAELGLVRPNVVRTKMMSVRVSFMGIRGATEQVEVLDL